MNTIAISVSAAPQARSWGRGNTCCALLKICTDSAVLGPSNRFVFVALTVHDREQQRRGLARGRGRRRAARR